MATWIASPTGTPGGDGSLDSPWDLATAVQEKSAVVQPDDTIYLRGGRYQTLGLQNTLTGEAGHPIIVRPYPGEPVIIDGNRMGQAVHNVTVLDFNGGAYVRWMGTRITNSGTDDRILATDDSNPPERRGTGINVVVPGIELINNVIDNCGQGISPYSQALAFIAYGNIVFDNGWEAPLRGHGHGIYSQSSDEKWLKRNVVGMQFGNVLHIYGSADANLDHYRIHENVFLGNAADIGLSTSGSIAGVGGLMVMSDLQYTSNFVLNCSASFGGAGGTAIGVAQNYFSHIPGFTYCDATLQVSANRIYCRGYANYPLKLARATVVPASGVTIPDWGFSGNYYWLNGDGSSFLYTHDGVRNYTAAQWVSDGQQDADSTFYARQPGAADDTSTLWVNEYDATIATLTILNFSAADIVSVELSDFADANEYVRVRNAQNYFGDIAYTKGGTATFDMRAASHSVSTPIGYASALATTSFPTYGVFVLEKYTPIQKARSAVPFIRRRRR